MKMSRYGFIYMISFPNPIPCRSCSQDTQQTFYKIGYTTNDPNLRKSMLETDCPFDVGTIKTVMHDKNLESFMHDGFSHCMTRIGGGSKEWFILDSEEAELAESLMDNPLENLTHRRKKYRPRKPKGFSNIDLSDL